MGDAVYPAAPTSPVSAHPLCLAFPGGGDPFQMRPRVALSLFYQLAGAAVLVVRVRKGGRRTITASFGPSKAPARRPPVAPGPTPPSALKPARRGSARWGITAGFAQRRSRRRDTLMRGGANGPVCGGSHFVVAALALSPLVPRARTGVSPALPWNALGCVGAGAPALSIAGFRPVR